jgi:hypothetical protein
VANLVAEGVVLVGVGDRACGTGQLPDAAPAVVLVEARYPGAVDNLVFTDALQAVGVGARDYPVRQLIEYLRKAGGIDTLRPKLHRISRLGATCPMLPMPKAARFRDPGGNEDGRGGDA